MSDLVKRYDVYLGPDWSVDVEESIVGDFVYYKDHAARIAALEARVAAADALVEKCLELSQEAYGYDRLYETTFHRDVHETLRDALAAYEATKEQSDG